MAPGGILIQQTSPSVVHSPRHPSNMAFNAPFDLSDIVVSATQTTAKGTMIRLAANNARLRVQLPALAITFACVVRDGFDKPDATLCLTVEDGTPVAQWLDALRARAASLIPAGSTDSIVLRRQKDEKYAPFFSAKVNFKGDEITVPTYDASGAPLDPNEVLKAGARVSVIVDFPFIFQSRARNCTLNGYVQSVCVVEPADDGTAFAAFDTSAF